MKSKHGKKAVLTLAINALLIISLLQATFVSKASPTTTVYIDPPSVVDLSLTPGSNFTVRVMVSDVEDLSNWQIMMTFNESIVEAIDITQGDFLAGQPEGTQWVERIQTGYCMFGEATMGMNETTGEPYPGVMGSGWLGSVKFEVNGMGASVLNITNPYTYLLRWTETFPYEPVEIPCEMENGYFSNTEVVPDFSISASPDSLTIQQGSFDTLTITVTSLEEFNQTVDLTVSGVPLGVTTLMDPSQVTPPADGSITATLTVEVDETAGTGTYVLTITGTNGTLEHSVDITLEILEIPPPTVMCVDPCVSTANPGDYFTINIGVTNVTDLYAWQFKMSWVGVHLECTEVTEGAFLKQGGTTKFAKKLYVNYINIGCSLLESVLGVSGDGTLATVEFFVEDAGNSTLELYYTKLVASNLDEIPHAVKDGYFYTTYPVASYMYSPHPTEEYGRPIVGETVTFNATTSYDPDQFYQGQTGTGIVSYTWDFNDGTPVVTEAAPIITHIFDEPGSYIVTLTVTDDDGETYTVDHPIIGTTILVQLHDIAVIDVTAAPTVVSVGDTVAIDVTVLNEGSIPETLNVTAYYDDTPIQTKLFDYWCWGYERYVHTLDSGEIATTTLTWDTTGVPPGTYTISVEAYLVHMVEGKWVSAPGIEQDLSDNTFTDGSIVLCTRAKGNVLFDQTHGTDYVTSYSTWIANLTDRGYTVDAHTTGPITASVLVDYDVFVIPQAHSTYSTAELAEIQDFVSAGGGLLVIGDDDPYIYTDLTDFAGISWVSGGTSGITTDITPHEVTLGVGSVYMAAPIAMMYVTGLAQDLVRDPAGNIMLAVSEQVGRVIGFADEDSLWDHGIVSEDNLRLANNMIDWLLGIRYEHELIALLEAPSRLQTGDSSLLNATVYNRGLSNETDVELYLLINGTIVNNVTIRELVEGTSYTIDYLWTPTIEAMYNVTAYTPPVPDENVTANNVMSVFVNVQYLEVALFKNRDPWGYPANEEALSLYGIAYAVFSSSDIGLVDLSGYSKVVIASVQDQDFYNAMDAYRWWFEDYVSSGGILEIHAAHYTGTGWVGSLPGGLQYVQNPRDYVTIVDPTHPVVTTPNPITDAELDEWWSSVHGYFSNYPVGSRIVIIEDSSGYPAYLEFDYGTGVIVASSQTLEWAYMHAYSLILENSLLYSPIKYPHELAVTVETPTFLEPGDSSLLNATVYNRGLSNETDVELYLLINGTVVNNVTIPKLVNGTSHTIDYLWTPTIEAMYNVTAYAPPVPDENVTANNIYSAFVSVRFAPRILAYVQYTNYYQEYTNSLRAIDSTFGPAYILTELWDYTQLDSVLPGNDILFIPEQEWTDLYTMERIGATWSTTLSNFVEEGGVIILCDFNWGSGGTYGILTGAGLMSISNANYRTWSTVYLVDPTDPLASGVSSSFIAPDGTLSFVTDETNVVFDDGTYPVVIHKKVGQGHIALVGFDYYDSNPDTEQILGNAVGLALYMTISISPSAGSPGTEVNVTGIKAAANGTVEIYWDETFIGDVTADAAGSFTYLLTVPLNATAGLHEIRAVDVATGETSSTTFRVIFIAIRPFSGPIGTKVTTNGAGFSAHTQVSVTFNDMLMGYAMTDDAGNFTFVFNIPVSATGPQTVKAFDAEANYAGTTFTVIDVTPLEITMDVGSLYFKGETAVLLKRLK